MANVPLGDDKKERVTIRLPIWMIKQIEDRGRKQDVLEAIIAPHFKKELSKGEKTN